MPDLQTDSIPHFHWESAGQAEALAALPGGDGADPTEPQAGPAVGGWLMPADPGLRGSDDKGRDAGPRGRSQFGISLRLCQVAG